MLFVTDEPFTLAGLDGPGSNCRMPRSTSRIFFYMY
jgi:hypothetical protein